MASKAHFDDCKSPTNVCPEFVFSVFVAYSTQFDECGGQSEVAGSSLGEIGSVV